VVSDDPQFALRTFKHALPGTIHSPPLLCNEIIGDIQSNTHLPEYVLLTEGFPLITP